MKLISVFITVIISLKLKTRSEYLTLFHHRIVFLFLFTLFIIYVIAQKIIELSEKNLLKNGLNSKKTKMILFRMISSNLLSLIYVYTEEFEDTKGVIRIRISKKNRQHKLMAKRKSTKGQTTIYKTYI